MTSILQCVCLLFNLGFKGHSLRIVHERERALGDRLVKTIAVFLFTVHFLALDVIIISFLSLNVLEQNKN